MCALKIFVLSIYNLGKYNQGIMIMQYFLMLDGAVNNP
jgi:hypothetical protein